MSKTEVAYPKSPDQASRPQQVLEWAMCHPGVLVLSSLAVGTVLAVRREARQQKNDERRVETEADMIEGDVPLFI